MVSEVERKRKRAALWAAWYKKNPRTKEQKAKKAAREREWRKDNPKLSAQQAHERYQRDPKGTVFRVKKWRKEHPEQWAHIQRASNLWSKYGITVEEYEALRRSQNGACAICGGTDPKSKNGAKRDGDFAVDHNHSTGVVRGLLCNPCNSGIGAFGDDPELLTKAITYLKRKTPTLRSQKSEPRNTRLSRKEYNRAYNLKRAFGITLDDYATLRNSQNGLCVICGGKDPKSPRGGDFSVDHDHVTGVIRGLLCFPCNTGIGLLKDDPEILTRAIMYLTQAPTKHHVPSLLPTKRQRGRPRRQ